MNNHWKPYLSRCAYCITNYTVVAKLDTLEDDLSFIGEIRDVVAALVVDTDGTGDSLPVPPDVGLELGGSVGEDGVDEHVDATIELANAVTG